MLTRLRAALAGHQPPALGWWASLTLVLVGMTVIYTDTMRFQRPTSEKFVFEYFKGQTDFSFPYLGALALLYDVNPYLNDIPEFTHPIFKTEGPEGFKQLYPPSHLLTYVPLAWYFGNWEKAAEFWFHVLLGSVLAVGALAWALTRRVAGPEASWMLGPYFACCLAMSSGVGLGLDRGQADAFLALLTWAGVVLYLRGWLAPAMVLLIWATSMKGYPLLVLGGICVLEIHTARFWKRGVPAALLAVAILVGPVLRYLGDGLRATTSRTKMFWEAWFNHSFMSVVHWFSPGAAARGHDVLTVVALVVVAVAWVHARTVRGRGADSQEYALAFTVFATAALSAMIGISRLSVSYNLIMVLPGALVLVCANRALAQHFGLGRLAQNLLGAWMLGCSFMLFVHQLSATPLPQFRGMPASGFGLIGLLAVVLALCGPALVPRLRRPAPVAAEAVSK